MAADSTVVVQGDIQTPAGPQRQMLQSFNFATKVAGVKDYPMGVMTWGIGSINSRSIQSLIAEFEYLLAVPEGQLFDLKRTADELLAFITQRYDEAYPEPNSEQTLGLFVGGYSDGDFFSAQYSCEFPLRREWTAVRPDQPPTRDFGANWFGAADALQRLVLGFDPSKLQGLINRGVAPEILQSWIDSQEASLPIIFDGMPLQDAIDFAQYACDVVVGRWRFGLGLPIVGGDIDIAVLRPHSFLWAKRKTWSIKD